ncbi:MAG TPA: hypothetical protein VNV15_06455 [Opitutaceae bacterium]|nr:hypothetical protein [Opitutaceae bacterium]
MACEERGVSKMLETAGYRPPAKMTRPRKLTLFSVIAAAIAGVVVAAFPPYRSYAPDAIVRSVIAEVIIPTGSQPGIEWEDGARKLWQNHPAEVQFYGIEEAAAQNRILESVRKHLAESDLPSIAVRFFPKGRTRTHPVKEILYILIQK